MQGPVSGPQPNKPAGRGGESVPNVVLALTPSRPSHDLSVRPEMNEVSPYE